MELATYYLSSLESYAFEEPRVCRYMQSLVFENGKKAALVQVDPPVIGQQFGYSRDLDRLILTPRHEVGSIFPIAKFPCFVFITVLSDQNKDLERPIAKSDLHILAWGELYKSTDDAINKVFD